MGGDENLVNMWPSVVSQNVSLSVKVEWPISETNITCDSVTSFGGQIMEKTVRF